MPRFNSIEPDQSRCRFGRKCRRASAPDPADEVARLTAEAERRKLEQEVARLRAESKRSKETKAAAETRVREEALWQSVADSREVKDVQRYLAAYPGGTFASLARARIKQLASAEAQRQELTLWNRVKESRDIADLRGYVKAYPDGLFVDLAEARVISLCQRRSKISPPGRSKTSPLNVMRYAVLVYGPGTRVTAMSLSLLKFVGQASLVDDAMLPS